MAQTYQVQGWRMTFPKPAQAVEHPERYATLHGTFFPVSTATVDGKPVETVGKAQTRKSLVIDFADALHPDYLADKPNNRITLPAGERGAPEMAGVTEAEAEARLAQARKAAQVAAQVAQGRDPAALDALHEAALAEAEAEAVKPVKPVK